MTSDWMVKTMKEIFEKETGKKFPYYSQECLILGTHKCNDPICVCECHEERKKK